MKKNEAQAVVESGKPVVMAEYRGGRGEIIRWFDKGNGRQQEARQVVHALETASGEQFKLSERLPEGADVTKVALPAKRGDRVLVVLRSWSVEKGNILARGDIYPIEEK